MKRKKIIEALDECENNKSWAANKLGISRTTFWRYLKKYKIKQKLGYSQRSKKKDLLLKLKSEKSIYSFIEEFKVFSRSYKLKAIEELLKNLVI